MNSFDLMVERYKKEMEALAKNSGYPINREKKVIEEKKEEPVKSAVVMTQVPQMTDNSPDNADGTYAGGETGKLKVQVFAANGAYPITSAFVRVYNMEETKLIYEDYTDVSGIVENIELPTPRKTLSQTPENDAKSFASYVVRVSHPRFRPKKYVGVPVFAGIESIQPVQLTPLNNGNDTGNDEEIVEREPDFPQGDERNA